MAARIESHITVLCEMADLDRIRRAAAGVPPLRLTVSAANRWLAEPGIYLDVEDPHGDLMRFRTAVVGADLARYRPHVTILHRDSVRTPAEADEAWAALRDVRLDAPVVVRELRVYEEIGAAWRDGGRVPFASAEVLGQERLG